MDRQQLAIDLEPYLIGPPWHEDLVKRFPDYIQRQVAERSVPTELGNHHEYGYFALETTGQGPIILWMEVDPERKIVAPPVTIPQPARDPRGYLVGWVKFCPCCGANLRLVTPDDEWGDFCGAYRVEHRTEWFLCTGANCVYRNVPLVLHNPVRGWSVPPGDNWALGYVK